MVAYQSGIARFREAGAEVFGISTDNLPALRHWKQELGLDFPLLSDFHREVSRKYRVLMEDRGMARRVTFVIDENGKIIHIEEGNSAIDPTGALQACTRK